MKRKSRRKVNPFSDLNETQANDFFSDSSLILYNESQSESRKFDSVEAIKITDSPSKINWLNIYGFQYMNKVKKIIYQNNLDEFLCFLILENNHRN